MMSFREKQLAGSSFIEIQIALLILGFVIIGLGSHLQSLTKQVFHLKNTQENTLDLIVPFDPCATGDQPDCSPTSQIASFDFDLNKLEALIEKSEGN